MLLPCLHNHNSWWYGNIPCELINSPSYLRLDICSSLTILWWKYFYIVGTIFMASPQLFRKGISEWKPHQLFTSKSIKQPRHPALFRWFLEALTGWTISPVGKSPRAHNSGRVASEEEAWSAPHCGAEWHPVKMGTCVTASHEGPGDIVSISEGDFMLKTSAI